MNKLAVILGIIAAFFAAMFKIKSSELETKETELDNEKSLNQEYTDIIDKQQDIKRAVTESNSVDVNSLRDSLLDESKAYYGDMRQSREVNSTAKRHRKNKRSRNKAHRKT